MMGVNLLIIFSIADRFCGPLAFFQDQPPTSSLISWECLPVKFPPRSVLPYPVLPYPVLPYPILLSLTPFLRPARRLDE